MKSARPYYYSILGLLGSLCGWTLMQSGFHIFDAISLSGVNGLDVVLLNKFIFEGAFIGFGLGMVLQSRLSLWYHHDLAHTMSKMLFGALSGSVAGLFCFGLGHFIQILHISPILSRLISWTLLGVLIIGTIEYFRSHSEILWPRIISGGIGGFISGGIFEFLMLYQMSGPENLYGIVLSGFTISLFIGLYENHVTFFALRVLTGKQEGQIFLLDQNTFNLGYSSQNDFILNGYAEVCNLHAHIYKKEKQLFIENTEADSGVLVNYRQIDQQAMKKGDVIKIGTAQLQYYEI